MKKILFVCHGNICRSPMAEFVMKDLVKKAGLSSAVPYRVGSHQPGGDRQSGLSPGAAQAGGAWDLLRRPRGAAAHQIGDYDKYDLLIGMDSAEPAEYALHLRRRLCRQAASPDGLHRPPPRCCRPVVHRRLRGDLAGCTGGLLGTLERIHVENEATQMAQNDKIQLLENKRIRTAWDEEKEEWYFSTVFRCGTQ